MTISRQGDGKEPDLSLLWNISAALSLTISVTMLTDFSRRMLGSDPDSVGILSISVQALFAVAATSSFTKSGGLWLQSLFSRLNIQPKSYAKWRFLLAAGVFALLCPTWLWAPSKLALLYNDRGYNLRLQDPASAKRNYERAIALDTRLSRAHFNLAELHESSYQYDKASSEYQNSIVSNPGYAKGYNNLARVLLIQNNAMTALRVLDDALSLKPVQMDQETNSALYKNRAWAEFQLGFYEQGLVDAKASMERAPSSAAPYCILGKIYGKLARSADAQRAWDTFNQLAASPNSAATQPMIEPDCKRLAQGANHETK